MSIHETEQSSPEINQLTEQQNALLEAAQGTLHTQGIEVRGAQRTALELLVRGGDLQLFGGAGAERTAVYAALLAQSSGKSLVVCGSAVDAESVVAAVQRSGAEAAVAGSAEDLRGAFVGERMCVVSTPAAVVQFLKSKSAAIVVHRCVVDSVDSVTSAGPIAELEGALAGIRDGNPDAQIVLMAGEPSLTVSALSRRFLRAPQACSMREAAAHEAQHIFYEVGTALLSKPQALCDLIELEGGGASIVFCNSPSDADFADVILRKRGISSLKLVGYVPQIKLSKAIQQIQKGEVRTLVLTDVAARGIPLEEFFMVVNYSVPVEPEVYFHRYAASAESKTTKVVSLVAPLDLSNFHYLRKLGKLEFEQGQLPTPEQLFVTKFGQLKEQALEKGLLGDPSISALTDKVLGDGKAREIVALLLHNTVAVIPSLKSAVAPREELREHDEQMEDEGEQPMRGGERRRGRGGRDRDGRDGRDGRDRDGRESRDGRDREGRESRDGRGGRGRRQRDQEEPQHDGVRASEGAEGSERYEGEEQGAAQPARRGDGERRERRQRRPAVVDKEARLYVGAGRNQGISESGLRDEIVSGCGLDAAAVHRISVRESYSFVDVPDAVAGQVIEKLGAQQIARNGERYFVKKAVTLSIPREGGADEEGAEHADEGGAPQQPQRGERSDHDFEQGPTMLAVDDQV